MGRISKNRKKTLDKIGKNRNSFSLKEAVDFIKSTTSVKFNESVDIAIRLGVDPKQSNQMVRGTVSLPHGTGKNIRVLVLCNPEHEKEAKAAGADFAGLDEYVEKISKGWVDVDVIITTPLLMPKIARLGKILGPRSLMPNPKSGTVTTDVVKTVKEVKAGKIDFKIDKTGIIHSIVGKVAFSSDQLVENVTEFIQTVNSLKPSSSKGIYLKSINISSTMGVGFNIETKTFTKSE